MIDSNIRKIPTVLAAAGLAFALVLGFAPATALAGPPDASGCHDHKPCDGGGPASITYTAELTSGAFVFNPANPVVVTPNSKENVLSSDDNLAMMIPGGDLTCWEPSTALECDTWNQVFNTCVVLLEPDSVDGFSVGSDKWRIDEAGGVRVIFSNILLQGAEVTVQLIGNEFDFTDPFLPEPGETRVFILDQAAIYGKSAKGGGGPRRGCQPPGGGGFDVFTLYTPSTLEIKATTP